MTEELVWRDLNIAVIPYLVQRTRAYYYFRINAIDVTFLRDFFLLACMDSSKYGASRWFCLNRRGVKAREIAAHSKSEMSGDVIVLSLEDILCG